MGNRGLVLYYSRKGQNYVRGKIVDLPIGNTEVIARKIQQITGSDLFSIQTVNSYPIDYTETTRVAQNEFRSNARPEFIKMEEVNINNYDMIYLGYPNWWGTMPMIVHAVLEQYDWSGKFIMPFCTHEGSGMGRSEQDIKKICSGAIVLPGLAIQGGQVNQDDSTLLKWLSI